MSAKFADEQGAGRDSGSTKISLMRDWLCRCESGRTFSFVKSMGVVMSESREKAGKHFPASKAASEKFGR